MAPGLAVGVHAAWEANDLAKAREFQGRLAPVRKLFGVGSHPGGLKEAMIQLGMIPCGTCRRPSLPLSPAQKQQVTAILKEAGLLQ